MNAIQVLKLLTPIVTVVASNLPASTPPWVALLVNTGVKLLGQFGAAGSAGIPQHVFGATGPVGEIPPQHMWNPDDLTRWAQARTQGQDQS